MIITGELVTTRNQPANPRGKRIPRLPMMVTAIKTTPHGRWVTCEVANLGLICTMPEECFQPWCFEDPVDFSEWQHIGSFVWGKTH